MVYSTFAINFFVALFALIDPIGNVALFAAATGWLAAATGCTLGGTVVFLVCRTAAGDVLRRRAGPAIVKMEDGVRRDAFSYILALRLIPVMPFWLANLALGFIDIPLGTFVVASFLGILPVSLIYAGLGSGLDHLFVHHQRPDLHLVMHANILLPLIALAILSLAPILWRRLRPSAGPAAAEDSPKESPSESGVSLPKPPA